MRTLTDIQQRILKEEYPTMSFDSDADIERYFELRKNGRMADALALYNNRLKRKYPNDQQRTDLMRYYRSRDPRYSEILRDNMIDLSERLVARTSYVIDLLTKEIDTVDMTDAYSVIKLAEGLLSVISPDRYVAIAFTEKYVRYAKAMSHRHAEMERTAELIRLYVTDTIESVQDFKKDREEKRRQKARQIQHRTDRQQSGFDLSKIVFSQEDLFRIQISPTITRTEDIVIAYCLKYWNLAADPTFEKTVFLYSRKYRTNHNDIFQAIRNGRIHGWKDEEILNAVLSTVVTGYYYSISGDVYLQRTWARYKTEPQIAGTLHAVPTETKTLPTSIKKAPSSAKKTRKTPRVVLQKQASRQTLRSAKAIGPGKKKIEPFKARTASLRRGKPELPGAPTLKPNSVADMIRKMTGKTYTVYKDLFFRGVRPSIRTVLSSSSIKRGNLFGNRQNDAEEIVYDFLHAHYDDPYQNWKDSNEKKSLEGLGYAMPALEPVIEGWIKSNE